MPKRDSIERVVRTVTTSVQPAQLIATMPLSTRWPPACD